ncbi:MAG TPA: alanine/glycine:cation symporter family protein [Clostridia bacterium]|nr:alanine/glycine:cation symporter family protein [Clostridia bacterium]
MLDEQFNIGMAFLLLAAGVYFSGATRFFQLTHFFDALFAPFRRRIKKPGISPFRALSTALAGSVGTGNIAGVASALAIGGPGAVFWMWVSAVFGMATKFAEVVLALKYRERGADGEWKGGAMYCIVHGMGENWRWLAAAFCMFGMLASFGVGNMVQVNTISAAAEQAVFAFSPGVSETAVDLCVGLLVAAAIGIVTFGGAKRVGAAAEVLVPFMSILYIVATLLVIAPNADKLSSVLNDIMKGAFGGFRPALGGITGFTIAQAFKCGMQRGVFSNEAGLGSAPIAHAAAEVKNPVEQGMMGVVEVFIDTIVICSLTAFMVLLSGIIIPYGNLNADGMEIASRSLSTAVGTQSAGVFLAAAVLLFAFCSILTWSLYGTRCAEFLFGKRGAFFFRILFLCGVIVGASLEASLVWRLGETFNSLMAIPNLIMLIVLAPVVVKEVRSYKTLLK